MSLAKRINHGYEHYYHSPSGLGGGGQLGNIGGSYLPFHPSRPFILPLGDGTCNPEERKRDPLPWIISKFMKKYFGRIE